MSDQYSDQVFNYLMEEMLRGPKPPDLSVRIHDAWRREQAQNSRPNNRMVTAELVDASPALAPTSTPALAPTSTPTYAQLPASTSRRRRRARPTAVRSIAVSAALVAASVALAYFGWQQFVMPTRQSPSLVENQPARERQPDSSVPKADAEASDIELATLEDVEPVMGQEESDRDALATLTVPEPKLPSTETSRQASQAASGEALATNSYEREAGNSMANPIVPSPPDGLVKSNRREGTSTPIVQDDEIVSAINRQFFALWRGNGTLTSPRMTAVDLAEKLHRQLLGKPLPELEKQRLTGMAVLPAGWIQQLLDAPDFDQHWASRISRSWLRGSSWPYDSRANEVLTEALAQYLRDESGWDQVVRELVGGELHTGSLEASTDNASSVLLAGWSSRYSNSNHRLVRRLGANFLNANLACVQCHDASGENFQHALGQQWSAQQSYWNLMGLFDGVSASGNGYQEGRTLSDEQKALFQGDQRQIFYELPDGKLQALSARLPNGKPWRDSDSRSPRQAFAAWLTESDDFDQATVNLTWRMMFGRHLAPQSLAIEELADEQRNEILISLARHFRDSGRDMKRLVGWIARSEPFQRAKIEMGRSEWLAANEQSLQQLQRSETLFAMGSTLGATSESNSLDSSIQLAMKWSSTFGVAADAVMLAQPNLAENRSNPSRGKGNPPPMPPLSFAIHGQRFSDFENAYIRKLAESEALDWQDKAAHVILLSEFGNLGNNTPKLAADVLEHHAGDVESALRTLLWSVKNFTAN